MLLAMNIFPFSPTRRLEGGGLLCVLGGPHSATMHNACLSNHTLCLRVLAALFDSKKGDQNVDAVNDTTGNIRLSLAPGLSRATMWSFQPPACDADSNYFLIVIFFLFI
jgi:hypothetical protein